MENPPCIAVADDPYRVNKDLDSIIPDDDKEELEKMGVAKVFTPGAPTEEAVEFLRKQVALKKDTDDIM